jgi:hypothetical protein
MKRFKIGNCWSAEEAEKYAELLSKQGHDLTIAPVVTGGQVVYVVVSSFESDSDQAILP